MYVFSSTFQHNLKFIIFFFFLDNKIYLRKKKKGYRGSIQDIHKGKEQNITIFGICSFIAYEVLR